MNASTVFCCRTRTACCARLTHQDRGGRVAALAEDRGLAGEKGLENLAEDLVLPEQLMHRCPLIEPQEPELRRLGHHRRVGGNLLIGGSAQIARDLLEQVGNVVEELMSREHIPLLDRQELVETLEPEPGRAPCDPRPAGTRNGQPWQQSLERA